MYKEGIKYINLIEISTVVIEIQGVEHGDLVGFLITHLFAVSLSWPLTHNHVS